VTGVPGAPSAEALRASLRYHFAPTDVPGVFARHASVQYDPLSPLGCSHDLVFAARVPGYRVGDWRRHVYRGRVAYDGWDKQASLVETAGQPARRIHHRWNAARWHDGVLAAWPEQTEEVLAQLRERGPLEALEVEASAGDGGRIDAWEGSWYGPRLAKRILRALWHTGRVATHHRRGGRHVYDLIERVIPEQVLAAPTPDEDAAVRRLVLDRHRAAGLLRPTAPAEVWSLKVPATARHRATAELVDAGELVPVDVAGVRHHAVPGWLEARDAAGAAPGARFVAPLDPLLWDRPGVRRAFGFDYLWEVYKPEAERRWGWYVLPVAWRDRFVARIDAALETGPDGRPVWRLRRWWWEEGAEAALDGAPGGRARFLADLEAAASAFAHYLGVRRLVARGGVPREVAAALRAGAAAPAPAESAP
jgi:uncharacterized protein YcaQ